MIRQPIIAVLGHVDAGKCVAKGTKIFLANGETIRIEEIYETAKKTGKTTICEDGLYVELEKPLFVFGEDNKKIKSLPATHVWKREKKELIRIKCNNGFCVELTPEHPLPVMNESFGISYVPAIDLQEKQSVLVPAKLLVEQSQNQIERVKEVLFEKLVENNFIAFLEEDFSKTIVQLAGVKSHTTEGISLKENRIRLPQLKNFIQNKFTSSELIDKIITIKQSSTKWRAGHTSKRIGIPKTKEELEDFFYFAGLFYGDGENKNGKLTNNDLELLEFYKAYSERVFKIESKIQPGHTCLEAAPKGGKTLTKFLQAVFEIPEGKKSTTIHIPKIIEVAPNSMIAKFIRGYFDTDGYVTNGRNVEVSTNSKKMAEELTCLLLRFGIRAYIRKNKIAYRVTISGKTNVGNFLQHVGFDLTYKKLALDAYKKQAIISRVLDSTPIKGNQLRQLRQEFGVGNKRLKIPFLEKTETYPTVSLPYTTQFVKKLKTIVSNLPKNSDQESLNKLSNLEELVNGNLNFATITKKEYIKNEHGYVYDLTQPKSHNFVANGLLLHNTSFLDSVRSTNIADKEPGKITQHIGATEIPFPIIDKIAGELIKKFGFNISIPGLLFIDTPGHEAFNNLRERGGSIADLAVVVVDVQKGLEPQTIESLQMLKNYKVPFIIAANKIDMIREYYTQPGSFIANLKNQSEEGIQVLDTRIYELVGKLFDQGFQSERFDRVKDFTKEICIVPMSALKKEGLPEVLMLLSGLSQKFLESSLKIEVSGPGKGTVLEVKEVKGIGTTIDAIIYDGTIKVGEEFVVAGMNGVIQTKVKALMQSKTLTDLRVAEKFNSMKEVHASAGVKIAAQKLEEAIAGSPLLVVSTGKEKEVIEKEVKRILFESQVNGVLLKADTLGAVEAITKLFQQANIPVRRVGIGAVTKRDILEALSVKDKDKLLGAVFAFNVEINELAQKELQKNPVQIFQEKIVYNLIKNYSEWKEQILNEEKKAMKEGLMFPAKFKIMKGLVFRNNKPAIVGVKILEGRLRKNVNVMNKEGKIIGRVIGIQEDKESVDQADHDDEVAVSIEDANVGRNVVEEESLYTALSANQIQRLKELQEKGGDLSRQELELLEEIEKMQGIEGQ